MMISKEKWLERKAYQRLMEWLDSEYQRVETEDETHDRRAAALYGDYPIEQQEPGEE